ncbi:MAG: Uma2 family endonuclease [Spirulina sp. SIO3F2]|nr:Uma2 family endonuclease [Spirulina sp. SIO3F2]
MVQQLTSAPERQVPEMVYPDSDGQPMADNTLQFEWIVTIKENLELLFSDNPEVFVAGDLLWYPVEGDNKTRRAPDAMVAFGRPKGYRGSYQQWKEDQIAPQVVFEVLSPGNTLSEMAKKLAFYQRFGVEEYYLYNPYSMDMGGWQRSGTFLAPIAEPNGWVSPRLGIRFETTLGKPLKLFTPQSQLFLTFVELGKLRAQAEAERDQIAAERDQIVVERDQVTAERDQERQRVDLLTAKLRELGIDPNTLT